MSGTPAERVGAVVVTFHPDTGFSARVHAIAEQVQPVIVVDNTPDAGQRATIAHAARAAGAEYVTDGTNCGVGAALNRGFSLLAGRGCELAVAFDQDSIPDDGCVAALLKLAHASPGAAVIGSNWRDAARPDEPSRHLVGAEGWRPWFRRVVIEHDREDVAFVINSGALFRLETWRRVGGFREELFLDLVDTEFCLRVRASGATVAIAAKARMLHQRGAKRAVRRFGRTWWPAFMPPARVYLLVRNRVWAILHRGWRRWPWVAFELTHTAFVWFSILFLEDQKAVKLAAYFRGKWDGLRGRLGPPR